MAIFTAEQQAYLDGVHNTLLDAVDLIEKRQSELYFAIEGIKAILAFEKQLSYAMSCCSWPVLRRLIVPHGSCASGNTVQPSRYDSSARRSAWMPQRLISLALAELVLSPLYAGTVIFMAS